MKQEPDAPADHIRICFLKMETDDLRRFVWFLAPPHCKGPHATDSSLPRPTRMLHCSSHQHSSIWKLLQALACTPKLRPRTGKKEDNQNQTRSSLLRASSHVHKTQRHKLTQLTRCAAVRFAQKLLLHTA